MVRITPEDAQKMMAAYAKVYAPKEEPKPETEAAAETPADPETPADTAEKDKQKVFTREKMSKFGDLISGVTPESVVEAPTPVVEEAPAPVVEEEVSAPVSFDSMSKDELEDYGRTVGIELDRRLSKKKLITQLEDHIQYLESV